MVGSQARNGADTVEERHVEVEDGSVGVELVGELDRAQSVGGLADDV